MYEERFQLQRLMSLWAASLAMTGCLSLRPVPIDDRPLAQSSVGGVTISVPRLDTADYPAGVLDGSTAVLLMIGNHSGQEIIIDPDRMLLGPADGMLLHSYAPELLMAACADAVRLALPAGRLLPEDRTGGFVYFPRMEPIHDLPLILKWSIREAQSHQIVGTLELPLLQRAY